MRHWPPNWGVTMCCRSNDRRSGTDQMFGNMVKQYPHFLFRKAVAPSIQDENGEWTTSTEEWIFHSACREEPTGKGTKVNLADGQMITFSALVQCPKGTPGIPEGTIVKVCEGLDPGSTERIRGECLKSSVDQFHSRIWL